MTRVETTTQTQFRISDVGFLESLTPREAGFHRDGLENIWNFNFNFISQAFGYGMPSSGANNKLIN